MSQLFASGGHRRYLNHFTFLTRPMNIQTCEDFVTAPGLSLCWVHVPAGLVVKGKLFHGPLGDPEDGGPLHPKGSLNSVVGKVVRRGVVRGTGCKLHSLC
ncbi:unnamed protein product [Rangifer tarandus platyrhynchus]|uniref:Uncharacterized protein n=1 Tax=Rangifer tarandus platyrhynchus TaxID=3082113 RepID=A0AC59ZYW1_RANTA